jgi:hypothetical protein
MTKGISLLEIAKQMNARQAEVAKAEAAKFEKVDGRSLRKTGRTHPFSTHIKRETHNEMKRIVARDGITIGELIEKAIEAYEAARRT